MSKRKIIGASAALAVALGLSAAPASADKPECNWGHLTAGAIADGFDQGGHSADPSGDGNGPEQRVGLANVVNQGDLDATCQLIDDLFNQPE